MSSQLTLPSIPPVYKPRAKLPKGFSVYKIEDTIECMIERISKLIFKPNVGGDIVLQDIPSMKGGYKILHTPMDNLTDNAKLLQMHGYIVVHTTSGVYLGYMIDETGQTTRHYPMEI